MARSQAPLRLMTHPRQPPPVASAVLGTLIFVVTEAMLFAGLISAFVIVRASAPEWPPADQPRLPVVATAFNTAALLLSAVVLLFASRAFKERRQAARQPLLAAIGLGAFFVVFQGVEWVRLIGQGLTLTSSNHGSFFYLIVGMHAVHAVGALAFLVRAYVKLVRHKLSRSTFAAAQVFWYFVVGLWPILYLRVYL